MFQNKRNSSLFTIERLDSAFRFIIEAGDPLLCRFISRSYSSVHSIVVSVP